MGQSRKSSVVTDRSSGNFGDQPLSPPDTPCPPFTRKYGDANHSIPKDYTEAGRFIPPWEAAKQIALSPGELSVDNWQVNYDPHAPDLEATWNPYAGLHLRSPSHCETHGMQQINASIYHLGDVRAQTSEQKQTSKYELSDPGLHKARPNSSTPNTMHLLSGISCVGAPSPLLQKIPVVRPQQMVHLCIMTLASVGYVLILTEQIGLTHLVASNPLDQLSMPMAACAAVCLAYTCYVTVLQCIGVKIEEAGTSALLEIKHPSSDFSSTCSPIHGLKSVQRSQELQKRFTSDVLRALASCVLCDMLRTDTPLWPLLNMPLNASNKPLADPPVFAPSPRGALIGIFGYPPRHAEGQARFSYLLRLRHILLPIMADGARIVGLWFAFKALRQIHGTESAQNYPRQVKHCRARQGHMMVLVLAAVLIASVIFCQAFWSSACFDSLRDLFPPVGERAAFLAGLLLRAHAILLAIVAALSGCVLAAAFGRLSHRQSVTLSKLFGVVSSLSFLCYVLFDVFIAAAPSLRHGCAPDSGSAEMHSGFSAIKAFATAATVAHLLAQLCLSLSVITFGFKDALVNVASNIQSRNEAHCLGFVNRPTEGN
ncbi:uncharacterized protein LOC34620979 [Cyclospora cayetanensis]|nr:uncharacterized protein LOC34620979 [Cyclospora cayetanensis]